MPRRTFLQIGGIGLSALTLARLPVAAAQQPTRTPDFARLVPPQKRLNPRWIQSLFRRGSRVSYLKSRNELRFIGMPVGGLCCGTLYLAGDGRLWLWDIFNENRLGIRAGTATYQGRTLGPIDGSAYVDPPTPQLKVAQGFVIRVSNPDGQNWMRHLAHDDWPEIRFTGEYPVAEVEYTDADFPVVAKLEAFSPFVPLNADDSGLPATIQSWTLTNRGRQTLTVDLVGWLENACSLFNASSTGGQRVNQVRRQDGCTMIESRFEPLPLPTDARPDLIVADFEGADFGAWKSEGTAFGSGPLSRAQVPPYQGDLGMQGERVVNSHAAARGDDVGARDALTGKLTSPPFVIQRRFLSFLIGGGNDAATLGLRLLVDGTVVRSAVGQNANKMRREIFDVNQWQGQTAKLEIVDEATGAWGNIGVDHILQTDRPDQQQPIQSRNDWGTMSFAVLESDAQAGNIEEREPKLSPALFEARSDETRKPFDQPLIGTLRHRMTLRAGESRTVTFVIGWHFRNNPLNVADASSGNYYAKRFADAGAVALHVSKYFDRLSGATKLWRDTWRDSTLPHWFLMRSHVNVSVLATSTAHRFGTGRFWGWEGIGCCEGTCTHVWHYAQAVGRLFPELERDVRERVDFGVGFNPQNGAIGMRGEGHGPAVDGQAGRILGAYREHQMSRDDAFLRRLWPRIKQATQFLLDHDFNRDGVLDGAQDNTLDAAWFGEISWLSSLYLASLRASAAMADEMNDGDFATVCRQRIASGKDSIQTRLWNGEHFIQRAEAGRQSTLGTYSTCSIDQVMGEWWLRQVGLPRVLDRDKILSALRAIYKYNFVPDIGPFRKANAPGRWYAVAGEGGLLMAANYRETPNGFGDAAAWQYGYFNECMSGFEHEALSNMISEGMLMEGLVCLRAIHDRYHAARRNPYNEIECSDHYARSMASYGAFISICGFEHHGPRGHIGWAPRLSPDNFRAAFTAAEGWGTFAQQIRSDSLRASIAVKHGTLRLQTIALAPSKAKSVTVRFRGKTVSSKLRFEEGRALISLSQPIEIGAGQTLSIAIRG